MSSGLLNERVDEQHAAYGIAKQERHQGLPYPGVLLLDEQGRVMQKRFQQSYRERETGVGILAQGFGVTSSVHGPEAHGQSEGVNVRAYLDTDTYRFFQRLWLTVELTIEPGVRVYAGRSRRLYPAVCGCGAHRGDDGGETHLAHATALAR